MKCQSLLLGGGPPLPPPVKAYYWVVRGEPTPQKTKNSSKCRLRTILPRTGANKQNSKSDILIYLCVFVSKKCFRGSSEDDRK